MADIVQPFTTKTQSLPKVIRTDARDYRYRCPICGGLNYVCVTA